MSDAISAAATADKLILSDEPMFRFNLAKWIIIFVFSVTGGLGIVAIFFASSAKDNTFGYIKDILGILLPVLSAWAGTVIAFYFGRENFESGTRSSMALAKQLTSDEKLKSIILRDSMISIGKAVTFTLDKPEKNVKIKTDFVDLKMEKENKERLPILDAKGCIKYMVHRSILERFILQEVLKGRKPEDLTLEDMLGEDKYKTMLTSSYKTLPETANLGQAKALMDQIKICSDVFVTEDGTSKSKVTGWVTNIAVQEQAIV